MRVIMLRFKVIVNPTSNKGANQDIAPEIEKELTELGLDFELAITDHPWHATEIASNAVKKGFDAVIACGGDGTSNEVINGLMMAKNAGDGEAKMGILPIGRGNDFNYGLDNPEDWRECCRLLAEGKTRRVDIGYLEGGLYPEGRYFGNQIGIGFDAVVGFLAAEQFITGFPGYLLAAIRTMFIYHPVPVMELSFDGEPLTQASLMVTMMNGCRAGGGFMIAPDHKIDDGFFDVCITDDISRAKILPLALFYAVTSETRLPSLHVRL